MKKNEISIRLTELRLLLGFNQTKFAQEIGIPRTTLVGYEAGNSIPADFLKKVNERFLASIEWLTIGTGFPIPLDVKALTAQEATNQAIKMIAKKNDEVVKASEEPCNKPTSIPFAGANEPAKSLQVDLSEERRGAGYRPLPIVKEVPDGVIIPLLDQGVSAGYGKALADDDTPALYLNISTEYGRFGALYALSVYGDSMSPTLDEGDIVVCDSGGWAGDGVYVIRSCESAFVKRITLTSKGYTVISDNDAYPAYSESLEDIEVIGKVRCAVVRFK